MTATSARIDPADHLPDYNAAAGIKGLSENVDIWRDEWGIPHIRGKTFQDAFAGLGFAQAQDRLWQMEALLRRGTGRYAEWLGARALPADTGALLVHAINPYGFAWTRRVNEDNADLNRNFRDFAMPAPVSPAYPRRGTRARRGSGSVDAGGDCGD